MNNWQKARARMMTRHAFFASIMMSTPAIETRDVPTLATDMKTIWYNPDFIAGKTVDEIMFGIAHEVLHIALLHGERLTERDPQVWNMACDYAINLTLRKCGFTLIANVLVDNKYNGMSADQIYDLLMRDPDKQPSRGADDNGGMGSDLKPMTGSADDVATAKRQVMQKVAQAATMARMCGQLPGELERLVGELLNPVVPWYEMLQHLMNQTAQDNEHWNRRNRRFAHLYLPGRWSQRMGEVILIGDTSGSIGNDELGKYVSEGASLAEQLQPERIRILWADTCVAGEQVFELGDPIEPEPQGGGGTDMRVPLADAEQHDPLVVVLFTDGYTPWPQVEPSYPLIVCCTTNAPVPIGTVVRI